MPLLLEYLYDWLHYFIGEAEESDSQWTGEITGWKRPRTRTTETGTGQHQGKPTTEGRRGKNHGDHVIGSEYLGNGLGRINRKEF